MNTTEPIVYIALAPDDRPILTTCHTLNDALMHVAADCAWNVLPIALDIDGHWLKIDQILALFTPPQEQERHVGG